MRDFSAEFLTEVEQTVLARDGRHHGDEIGFRCINPAAHRNNDARPSANYNTKKHVYHCPVCGAHGGVLDLADHLGIERPNARSGEGVPPPADTTARAHPPPGCTLAQYAETKQLPVDYLRRIGLTEITYMGEPAVRIPHCSSEGEEVSVQFRAAMEKPEHGDRFRLRKGSKAQPYGQERLSQARERGAITLVEGASDCHTLWYHGEPALGLPGANTWNEARDAPLLDGIDRINVRIEPDSGGVAQRVGEMDDDVATDVPRRYAVPPQCRPTLACRRLGWCERALAGRPCSIDPTAIAQPAEPIEKDAAP